MDNFFLLVTLLCIPTMAAAMIRPQWFAKLFRKNFSRAQLAGIFGGTLVVSFILFGMTTDAVSQTEVKHTETTPQTENKIGTIDQRQVAAISEKKNDNTNPATQPITTQEEKTSPVAYTTPYTSPYTTPYATPYSSPIAKNECTIKGNISSSGEKIYHVPGGQYYNATIIDTSKGEKWFCSESEAVAAGWRASKR